MSDRRLAVISGASKGIGYAIAEALIADGCDVMLLASNEENLRKAATALASNSAQVHWDAQDLRTVAGCTSAMEATVAKFGRVDILVNCAGATKSGLFLEQPEEEWSDGFALKFYAAVRLARLAWPHLIKTQGCIINIVGGFARTPEADFLVGGAVNAALANFSKGLSKQGMRDGVRVNAIYPGQTETDRVQTIFAAKAQREGSTVAKVREQELKRQGLARLGQPADVAQLTRYLCSDEAAHIQGIAIAVDGGATAGLY